MPKLKPWYHVVLPRDDLREGKPLDAPEFAAHLDKVRDKVAPRDYQDPVRFFDRTYLTRNLKLISTPHGFSGGGCFAVMNTAQPITSVVYRMFGIQACWYPRRRLAEVVPIHHWHAMVRDHLKSGTRD